MRYKDVLDSMLVMIFGCWWRNFDVGDIFWMLVPDANVETYRMLVTKIAKSITIVSMLTPQHFVSNIRLNIVVAKSWWYLYNYFCVHIKYANLYKWICIGMIGEEIEFGSRFYHAAFVFLFDVDVPIQFGYFEFLQHGFLQSLKLNIKSFSNHSGWDKTY